MYDSRLKLRPLPLVLILCLLTFVLFIMYANKENVFRAFTSQIEREAETVHLVAVSCGRPDYLNRKDIRKPFDQTLTMVKSAVLFTEYHLHVHIFTETEMMQLFRGEMDNWPLAIRAKFEYTIYNADYSQYLPETLVMEWKKWYKPCGSFRLFLPMIMQNISEAAIYSDSDVVFVKPINQLWDYLYSMSNDNVAAISPTAGHPLGGSNENINFISHPTGLFQINSGVMLLNFKRMLNSDWKLFGKKETETKKYGVELLLEYYKEYKDAAEHDQKLLNIMFHYNPDLLLQLPCTWNFKTNFCIDDNNVCESAESHGASAVHGIAGGFFNNGNPAFQGLYETFLEFDFDADLDKVLFEAYQKYLDEYAKDTYCGKKAHVITDSLRNSINNVDRW